MQIKGFVKTSFVDWDGKIVSTIFLPGCNFRCGFCYNTDLVYNPEKFNTIEFDEIKNYLLENKKFIDGVCIGGGEPTIHKDLPDLIKKIKELGFPVKLDTNGSNPDMIKYLIDNKLVDYVAMDIKAPLETYRDMTGVDIDIEKIKKTIDLIINSGIEYEFRTTVLPDFHKEENIEAMTKSIKGSNKYVLQKFILTDSIIKPEFRKIYSPTDEYMKKLKQIAEKYVKNVVVR